jgi:hypothetical protein
VSVGDWRQKDALRCCKLFTIVTTWEEMPISIGRHDNSGMTEALLHGFDWQLQATIASAIDA